MMTATTNPARPSWAVKCDDCKTTMRTTEDVRESYAGGICEGCREKMQKRLARPRRRPSDKERTAQRLAEMDLYTR